MSFLGGVKKITRSGREREFSQDPCSRCEGRGKIKQYKHIDEGVCYWCEGEGKEPVGRVSKPRKGQNIIHVMGENERLNLLSEMKAAIQNLNKGSRVIDRWRGEPEMAFKERQAEYRDVQLFVLVDRYARLKQYLDADFISRLLGRIRANLSPSDFREFEHRLLDRVR